MKHAFLLQVHKYPEQVAEIVSLLSAPNHYFFINVDRKVNVAPFVKEINNSRGAECYLPRRGRTIQRKSWGLLTTLGLLRMNNSIPQQNLSYTFRRCSFKLKNVGCVIGDKDADCKGLYSFSNCSINTNGRAFAKRYNKNQGNIIVKVSKTMVQSSETKGAKHKITKEYRYWQR